MIDLIGIIALIYVIGALIFLGAYCFMSGYYGTKVTPMVVVYTIFYPFSLMNFLGAIFAGKTK